MPVFANCAGQGGIKVKDVIVPPASGTTTSFQYALYDTGNINLVKPFQVSDSFEQVSVGYYRVRIRRLCTNGTSGDYLTQVVIVTGNTTSISNVSATPTVQPTISCSNGILATGPATGGGGGYAYALVPSVNAAEPVANYVRPKTSVANGSTFSTDPAYANFIYFTGLPAGTYFIRSYDQCGSYTTRSVVLTNFTENVTNITPTNVNRSRCDSVDILLKPYSWSRRFSNVAATLTPFNKVVGSNYTYTFSYGATSFNLSFPISKINTDTLIRLPISLLLIPNTNNITYTLSFTNDCGATPSRTLTSSVKDTILITNVTSAQNNCKINTTLTVGYTGFVPKASPVTTSYSFDSGATWKLNINAQLLNPGQSYTVGVANSCGDTTYRPITTPAYAFPVTVTDTPGFACPGKGGIYFRVNGVNAGPTNMDAVTVLSQPGTSLPASFTATNVRINVDTGKYVFSFKDICGNTQKDSVIVTPLRLQIQLTDIGVGGFCNSYGARRLVLQTASNSRSFIAVFINTATGVYTRRTHNPASVSDPLGFRQTAQYDLPRGNYTVKVWSNAAPNDSTCARTANFNNFVGSTPPSYSLSQSLFTSACADATATIVSQAIGGGGGNTYSLFQGANQLVAPSAYNIFNNLNPNSVYEVRAKDTCGNGTQYTTSFSNAPVPIYASQDDQPCEDDTLTLSTFAYENAIYDWRKNSLSVQTGPLSTYGYKAPSVGPFDSDTFRVAATYGTCVVPAGAKIVVNPAKCGQPLPVFLQTVRGKFLAGGNAQLSWKVANPDDFTAFSVQYSATGTDFKAVETLTADAKSEYSFVDNLRSDFVQYYRIKAFTKESEVVFSNVVTLRKSGRGALESEFSLVSNRVTTDLLVAFTTAKSGTANWQVLNFNGQVVVSGNTAIPAGSGQFSVTGLDPLPAGLYLIRILGEHFTPFAGKFEHL